VVADFNRRLRNGGSSYQFPESCVPKWLPKINNRRIYQEFFLIIENGSVVRGGYFLKYQGAFLHGKPEMICSNQLPLSEGIVDPAYRKVGQHLLANALRQRPLLYSLGMGGLDQPYPRALSRRKWDLCPVPFFFRIIRPTAFLRNITYLRRSWMRNAILDFLAASGIGWTAIKLHQTLTPGPQIPQDSLKVELLDGFDAWADDIWEENIITNKLILARDSHVLNILYPANDSRFIRLGLAEGGRRVGWAVGLNTKMTAHKHFGNMQLGSIVDCLALPGYEYETVAAMTQRLVAGGADLIVTNQSHASWCAACKKSGLMRGRTNYILAISPELAAKLGPLKETLRETHFNRGDGGGPIHL